MLRHVFFDKLLQTTLYLEYCFPYYCKGFSHFVFFQLFWWSSKTQHKQQDSWIFLLEIVAGWGLRGLRPCFVRALKLVSEFISVSFVCLMAQRNRELKKFTSLNSSERWMDAAPSSPVVTKLFLSPIKSSLQKTIVCFFLIIVISVLQTMDKRGNEPQLFLFHFASL
jgi:hypothetical protein